jgi:hypothetical protein
MTEALALLGAFTAWIGVTLVTVADGRRGVALGLLVTTAGLVLTGEVAGQTPLAVAVLGAGGCAAAALRLRSGVPGWRVLPPGSTPRLMAGIVVLAVAAVAAVSARADPEWLARLAAVVVTVLAGGRVLSVDQRGLALGGASAAALGLGALGDAPALVAAGVVAAGLGAIGAGEPAGEEG